MQQFLWIRVSLWLIDKIMQFKHYSLTSHQQSQQVLLWKIHSDPALPGVISRNIG